jgi:hypothetical protein
MLTMTRGIEKNGETEELVGHSRDEVTRLQICTREKRSM